MAEVRAGMAEMRPGCRTKSQQLKVRNGMAEVRARLQR